MKKIMTITAAAAVLICFCGCSSLIRQKKPAPRPQPPKTAQKAAAPAKPAPPKELTAAQIMAMTPEQLTKYHQEKQKAREQEELAARSRAPVTTTTPETKKRRNEGSRSLVDSFMNDRPSREKRRRLGDVSRQLDYSESTVFPWRSGRRSETLRRR